MPELLEGGQIEAKLEGDAMVEHAIHCVVETNFTITIVMDTILENNGLIAIVTSEQYHNFVGHSL